jgi:hypothetical protein
MEVHGSGRAERGTRIKHLLLALGLVLLATSQASARTGYIKPDGSGDAPTIQAGVDFASSRDTLLLADGTYRGDGNRNVRFPAKALTVRSQSSNSALCVVDCEGSPGADRRGFVFDGREGPGIVLEGMTVTNGYAGLGGAIQVNSLSAPTIRNCVLLRNGAANGGAMNLGPGANASVENCMFLENQAADRGGAVIMGNGCSPSFTGCEFVGNRAQYGGAIYAEWDPTPTFVRCTFDGNSAGLDAGGISLLFCRAGIVRVDGCIFLRNSGRSAGTIVCEKSQIAITSSTFAFNQGLDDAGGLCLLGDMATLTDCIIAYSTAGPAVYSPSYWPVATLACCDLYGNAGGDWIDEIAGQYGINGNFSECPSFCLADAEPHDLHLCNGSPCLPGNHPHGSDCGLVGALGLACDCGPSKIRPATWGQIKAQFRQASRN